VTGALVPDSFLTTTGQQNCTRDAWQKRRRTIAILKALATNPNLARIVDTWPNLPENIRTAIVALIVERSAKGEV